MCKCNKTESPCPTNTCVDVIKLSTDAITLSEDLSCSNILKGQTMTEVTKQLDEFICDKFGSMTNFFTIVNVGTGAGVYKGTSILGKKELKTLVDSNLITITEDTDEITIAVNETAMNDFIEANQKTYSATSVGTGANIYKDSTVVGDNTQFNFRKVKSTDNSVIITEDTNDINLTVPAATPPDGSETIITEGTNVTITGIGTVGNPYIINSTDTTYDGSETKVTQGSNISITGNGTTATPYVINTTFSPPDGSETKLANGVTTNVTGLGTVGSPYIIETTNLQKIITYPTDFTGTNYTITDNDNNYSIIINNSSTNVTITVPSGLISKIQVGFIQKGTGTVTFTTSGTSINYLAGLGLKIKGVNGNAYIEKEASTEVFYLIGNLMA